MSKKYFLVNQRGINYQKLVNEYQKIIPRAERVSCKSNLGLERKFKDRFFS
jgi:hypothetical protein